MKTSFKEFIEDLYDDEVEIRENNKDISFKEIIETLLNENVVGKSILNEGNITSIVNMMTVGLLMKIRNQSEKVKQEQDLNTKIDKLSDLIKFGSYGGLIGGFIGNKNTKILSKIRRMK
jgi:hypothetical protein